ncbi:MAG: hypothetical protein AVDCRST_MAG64-1604, partial [uncultured Phycisphaerae bacterium]
GPRRITRPTHLDPYRGHALPQVRSDDPESACEPSRGSRGRGRFSERPGVCPVRPGRRHRARTHAVGQRSGLPRHRVQPAEPGRDHAARVGRRL